MTATAVALQRGRALWRPSFYALVTIVSVAFGIYATLATTEVLPLLACLAIIPGLWLIEHTVGVTDPRRQTITSFWFLTYLVMLYWPAFLVYVDGASAVRTPYLLSVASGLVAVPLGAWFVGRLTGFDVRARDHYFTQPPQRSPSSQALFLVAAAITAAIAGSIVLYFAIIPEVPLFYMLRYPGCDLVLAQLREEAFKYLDPRYAGTGTLLFYLFLPLRTIVDPYIVVAFFGMWWLTRSRKWLILFLVVLALSSLYAAATIARAPVAAIVLRMFLLAYVVRAGALDWKSLAGWSLGVLAFPTLVTALAYSPGPPPTDCGPAAQRGPNDGRIALVDPLRTLSLVAAGTIPSRQTLAFAPGTVAAPSRTPVSAVVTANPTSLPTLMPATPAPHGTTVALTATPRAVPVTQQPSAPPAGVVVVASGTPGPAVGPFATVPATQLPADGPQPIAAVVGSLPPVVAAAATPQPTTPPATNRLARAVESGSTAAFSVVRRLTYTEAWALYLYYTVFPSQHEWLYGQTLIKPVLRFVGADFYVENFVYQKVFPTSPIQSGHLNAAFQSNLYADFGLPGVVVGGVLIGGLMHWIQVWIWRRPKNALWLATFPALVYAFWVLHSGSITSVLITNGALAVLAIPVTMLVAERFLIAASPRLAKPA